MTGNRNDLQDALIASSTPGADRTCPDTIPAMCMTCGTVRQVSARYRGKRLRCAECGVATAHQLIDMHPSGLDPAELVLRAEETAHYPELAHWPELDELAHRLGLVLARDDQPLVSSEFHVFAGGIHAFDIDGVLSWHIHYWRGCQPWQLRAVVRAAMHEIVCSEPWPDYLRSRRLDRDGPQIRCLIELDPVDPNYLDPGTRKDER